MNRAYARRLWQEGKVPCFVTATLLLVCNGILLSFGSSQDLFRTHPGSLAQSSSSEIGFGLVTMGLPLLVIALSVRGLAAEYGRGTLLFLAAQVSSRRDLVFTLWTIRAMQIASVLAIALTPFFFHFEFKIVAGAFLWVFIRAFLLFAGIELVGMLMGGLWRGILVLLPGLWALQITYSILQRAFHWPLAEPLSYAQNHWLFAPVLASAGFNLRLSLLVSAGWLLACILPALLCGEWLERAEIHGKTL